jgi:hypothetical protein
VDELRDRPLARLFDSPILRRQRKLAGKSLHDLADADRALALAPDNARLHLLRGKCLNGPAVYDDNEKLRCEAALASLERAMELAPREGSLRGDILWALMGTRENMRDEEAFLALLERALVELPEDEVVLLSVAKRSQAPAGESRWRRGRRLSAGRDAQRTD